MYGGMRTPAYRGRRVQNDWLSQEPAPSHLSPGNGSKQKKSVNQTSKGSIERYKRLAHVLQDLLELPDCESEQEWGILRY